MMYSGRLRKFIIFLIIFISYAAAASAQDFYWEQQEVLVDNAAYFSRSAAGTELMAAVWQDRIRETENGAEYGLSIITSTDGLEWKTSKRFLGPFSYTGKENFFFSLAVNKQDIIYLAVSNDDNSISLYQSSDGGTSFTENFRSDPFPVKTSPRLSLRSDGGMILFVTQESNVDEFGSLGIYYSVSDNSGRTWSEFSQLAPEAELKGNFLPSHTSYMGREYVAFQAFHLGTTSTFQLYLKYSDDGGHSWSDAVYISGFEDDNDLYDGDPYVFDNQRPFLLGNTSGIYLAWERGYAGNNPQIYFAELNRNGAVTRFPEQVSSGIAECRNPRMSYYRGMLTLIWFDNRAGDYHNIIARRDGAFWSTNDLNYITAGSSVFGNLLVRQDDLFVMWENTLSERTRLVLLSPDKTVSAPVLRAADFRASTPAKQDSFTVRWNTPSDSSGIAGYSWTYDRDENSKPRESLMMLDRNRSITVDADDDGSWFFHVIAQDYAGNWSDTATIEIVRDTTPPGTVTFNEPEKDERDTLLSNTLSLGWEPPPEEDVAGYSYTLQALSGWTYSGDLDVFRLRTPSGTVQTSGTSYSFRNIDNGLWALNVRAIDNVGNAGEANTLYFRLNKYIPVTYITSINSRKDELGTLTLEITGRGFSVGGLIEEVILDTDGAEPYDYVFTKDTDLYNVVDDRFIRGPLLEDILAGTYRVGLIHPERGLYFTRTGITLESSGTVKFGDFSVIPVPQWQIVEQKRFNIPFNYLLMAVVLILLVFLFVFTLQRAFALAAEGRTLHRQAVALIEGQLLSEEEKQERIAQMAKMRMGLRFKFALWVTLLVLLIVGMVAVPVAVVTSDNQRQILATGLEERAEVLLESITSGARTFLPSDNILELNNLPSQMSAMGKDAVSVTITGHGDSAAEGYQPDKFDYIWVTNDDSLPEDVRGTTGTYLMADEIASITDELSASVNEQAASRVGLIVDEIQLLNDQVEPLVDQFISTGDPEAEDAINQIQEELRKLDTELNARLYEIGNIVSSYPKYNAEELDPLITNYIFYKPVVYRVTGDDVYYRGLVRLGISTEGIIGKIKESRDQLILIIGIIAAAAIVIGILGALGLAAIIIKPINQLVRGVELIRDTEDKEELKSHLIKIKTGDELSVLADTVNQMTAGLVKAAAASKELSIGKDTQKQFIPLDKDSKGNPMTTGREDNNDISFYGYYEGAKGVSGDYFYYQKIDEVHYAAIKCDIAGKGVPASLIMVEVATLFLNFFRENKVKRDMRGKPVPPDISALTYSINTMLEERGFKGRFAAFTMLIVNSVTGEMKICNAGDTTLHYYDAQQRKMVVKDLPRSPAAGAFPSDMVEMGVGFVTVNHTLKKGDVLVLFTDGIEESKSYFRDADFNIRLCDYQGEEGETFHDDNHKIGSDNEEFGVPRIHDMLNAMKSGGKFSLSHYHNDPMENQTLDFDFNDCEDTLENLVIAGISVEKVFRLIPDPAAGPEDKVKVDIKVDEFLKKHFIQYSKYYKHRLPGKEDDQYVVYSHMKEEDQYDDLTVLCIEKK